MIGVFVQWNDKRSDSPGYIIDGSGCHIWVGARDQNGYGKVYMDGRMRYAHRARYEREIGPVPEGMQLDHYVCDGGPKGCCNPHHCRPVTPRENILRGNSIASARAAKTHCPKGHELAGDNLLKSYLKKHNQRVCRICFNVGQSVRRYRRLGREAPSTNT